jgi:hypothetical protein
MKRPVIWCGRLIFWSRVTGNEFVDEVQNKTFLSHRLGMAECNHGYYRFRCQSLVQALGYTLC